MTCPACRGRGELVYDRRPEHTRMPGPRWEPAEADVETCSMCHGTGEVSAQ